MRSTHQSPQPKQSREGSSGCQGSPAPSVSRPLGAEERLLQGRGPAQWAEPVKCFAPVSCFPTVSASSHTSGPIIIPKAVSSFQFCNPGPSPISSPPAFLPQKPGSRWRPGWRSGDGEIGAVLFCFFFKFSRTPWACRRPKGVEGGKTGSSREPCTLPEPKSYVLHGRLAGQAWRPFNPFQSPGFMLRDAINLRTPTKPRD